MRYFHFLMVFLLFFYSCTSDKSESNLAPLTPVLSFPPEQEECLFSPLTLEWTGSKDPEGDPVSYTVEVSKSNNFQSLDFFSNTAETQALFNLAPGTIYYWRVKAIDSKNNSSGYSLIKSFFTQPELNFNQFPYIPQLESPAQGSEVSGSKVQLKWTCSDADGDLLKYDIYLSSNNPPGIQIENIDVNSYEVSLEAGQTFFWRIAAKDGKGAKSFSPVWKFTH